MAYSDLNDRKFVKDFKRRTSKKRICIAALFLLFAVLMPGIPHATEDSQKTPTEAESDKGRATADTNTHDLAARVNGVAITREAVILKMARLAGTGQGQEPGSEDVSGNKRKEALDKLILQELAYQRAMAEGMKISRDELDAAITELKETVGGEEKYGGSSKADIRMRMI